MSDMDTREGVACGLCGEDGIWEQVNGKAVPLCDGCFNDQIDTCPQCEQKFFLVDGVRIYASASLYCGDCAKSHPVIVAGREFAHRMEDQK